MTRQHGSGNGASTRAPLGMAADLPVPTQRRKHANRTTTRGRIVIAAVATGAFAAAGVGQYINDLDAGTQQDTNTGSMALSANTSPAHHAAREGNNAVGGQDTSPDVLLSADTPDPSTAAADLKSNQHAISTVQAEHAEAARPKFARPGKGDFTSGFESRWGSFHYGIDLAASDGSPIYAAADGKIIEAGPASGFGLWVRQRLDDGTTLVYGHMQDYSVHAGQHVKAGEQIARVGHRGESTGPHVHFEVWNPSGKKVDPKPWLEKHDIDV